MVSANVISSMPWSNQRVHQVINEELLFKEFHCRTKDYNGIRWDQAAAQSSIIIPPLYQYQ